MKIPVNGRYDGRSDSDHLSDRLKVTSFGTVIVDEAEDMLGALLDALKGVKRLVSFGGLFSNYIITFFASSNVGGEAGCYGPSPEGWDRSVGRPEAQTDY